MTDANASPLLVACLCAEWCGTCRDYRPLMTQALASFDPKSVGQAWVDIEDDDEVVGTLDIENFPTVLIARGDAVLFFGTVTPHAQTLTRLVQQAVQGSLVAPPVAPGEAAEVASLPARVRAWQGRQ
jgi:thioredoxin-like negative regulator of GroEL